MMFRATRRASRGTRIRGAATAFAAAALFAVAPAQLAAQASSREIGVGATVTGRLTADDARLEDGSHYELYTLRGRGGESLRVTLRSSDFDAFLYFGLSAGPDCEEMCRADDDGGGGTDSRIQVTLRADGDYQIAVNSFGADQIGEYTLSVEAFEVPFRPSRRLFGDIGEPECDDCLQDDDGAGGTDARIETTVEHDADYMIVVNSLYAGDTGRYTLVVERDAERSPARDAPAGSLR